MNPIQDMKYVYLLQTGKADIFKIGYSGNIQERIQSLAIEHRKFAPFEELASIRTSKYSNVETYLHDRYEKHRLQREYFHFSPIVLDTVLHEFQVLNYAYQNRDVIYDLFIHPHVMDEVRQTRLEMLKVNNRFSNVINGRPVITVDEASNLTSTSPWTVYRNVHSGHWESIMVKGAYFIYLDQELKPPKRKKYTRKPPNMRD